MSGIRVNEWLHNSGTGGIWQTSAGNVGIASSVPTTKLEVTGDAKISGVTTATAFIPSVGQLSNRRVNINGAMQVWQRSTSASSVGGSNGYFAADRYRSSNNGSGRHTISRDTDTPTGEGFGHSMKIDVTTAVSSPSANNYTFIQHRIEGQDVAQFAKGTAGAKQYALSFWVKSPKTGVHVIQWEDVENSRSVQGTYTIASANTWEKHSIIFPADTTGGISCDASHRMQLYFWLFAGSTYNDGNVNTLGTTWATTGSTSRASGQVNVFDNTSNNFYITGIQLEVGSVATPFEHRSFADELERCKRYYEQFNSEGLAEAPFGVGYFESDTQLRAVVPLHEKRADVSFDSTAASTFAPMNTNNMPAGSAISLYKTGKKAAIILLTMGSSVTSGDGRAGILCAQSSTEATLKFDSEL